MSLRLAGVGAQVIGIARTASALKDLEEGIGAGGGVFCGLAGDLRDVAWAEQTGRAIVEKWGSPVLLISNAGHSIRRPLADYWDRFHDIARTAGVNYLGAVALALPILQAMVKAGEGHLLTVSSTSVDIHLPGWSAYCASKGAFEAWLRSVAPELRAAGVAVTSVHLPRAATAMSAPTAQTYHLPELSINQAADILCRAVVTRPRFVIPWWARLGAQASQISPGLLQRGWELAWRAGVRP